MRYLKQTKLITTHKNGNCYATSLACVLDLDIDEVPNVELLFNLPEPDNHFWADVMNKWLHSKGYIIRTAGEFSFVFHGCKYPSEEAQKEDAIERGVWDEIYFVIGGTSRGVQHMAIYKNGKLLHDPHPSNEGITQFNFCEVLEPLSE